MFRRSVALLGLQLIGPLLLPHAVVAGAEIVEPGCQWNPVTRQPDCGGVLQNTTEGASSAGRWPPQGWVPYRVVQRGPDGQLCETTSYRPAGIVAAEDVNQYDGGTYDPTRYSPCPAQVGDVLDPGVVAVSYWESIPIPKPRPHIAPGWGITGKPAFLETNGQLTFDYSTDTPIGGLTIRAKARYYVDWGDGEEGGPYAFEGRAWPDGRIVHEYIWKGEKDVVVTARWDATWELAGRSGVLRDRDVTAGIDDFPVREIQAVIIAGR
jgi:hypothetical protein